MDERRGIGERGPDKEKRDYNPKSLSNLKQNQKPASEANLSVNSGINWTKLGKITIVGAVILAIIWKLHQRKRNAKNE